VSYHFLGKGLTFAGLASGWKLKQRQLTSCRGGNRPSGCERFEKCRFRHSETIDSFHNIGLKFCGTLECMFDNILKFTGNFVLKTRAMFSSSHIAMRFFKERPVTSKRFFDLEFIQRHCRTVMLRISFGFSWLLTLVARLHGMADFLKHSTPIV
jgi:hypothetical protein